MSITNVQAYYYAWSLSHARSSVDPSRLDGAITDTKIDLNPHQVDAALFAFNSPLSKGAILADEVGLGKTIEAGILLCQKWAEDRRHLLIIAPASLRTQWRDEIAEKFGIPAIILESKLFATLKSDGIHNPFDSNNIVIVSYDFARRRADFLSKINWDLVVVDEAHKLRNVYKTKNVSAQEIKKAISPYKKVLLTATPLQNNLQELYGLISIIDDNFFSNTSNFAERYNAVTIRDNSNYGELKARLQTIIHRTLRKQVTEYVKYTKRSAITVEYELSDAEQAIYNRLSAYIDNPFTVGISTAARPLLGLLIRKILSSSSYALSYTLKRIIYRLENFDIQNITNEEDSYLDLEDQIAAYHSQLSNTEITESEVDELNYIIKIIENLSKESKSEALAKALNIGFNKMAEANAPHKALIFTESTRTQHYLHKFLTDLGYNVAVFNGTNNSAETNAIYNDWKREKPAAIQSGVSAVDKRKAIVDYFKEFADILIATEAGAEGINLQFCSLVINYDLPWNPQRIEQRIGRCHRYGQRHDVVVINFVNMSNRADVRVFELLNSKFNLFNGVLGASDEIIGAVESSIDFEKRIENIYRTCRTPQEIDSAFDALQIELDDIIKERVENSKKQLIECFDEDIINRFSGLADNLNGSMKKRTSALWKLIFYFFRDIIDEAVPKEARFHVLPNNRNITSGWYGINSDDAIQIRSFDGIGKRAIASALSLTNFELGVQFSLSEYEYKKAILSSNNIKNGRCIGYKVLFKSKVESFETFIFTCFNEEGKPLPPEIAENLFDLPAYPSNLPPIFVEDSAIKLAADTELRKQQKDITSTYENLINLEIDKIEAFAAEVLTPLENEVISLRKQVDELKRKLRRVSSPKERIQLTMDKSNLERKLGIKQREYFDKLDKNSIEVSEKLSKLNASFELMPSVEKVFDFSWEIA